MNQMITGSRIGMFVARWFDPGEDYLFESRPGGYDIKTDFAWAMVIRVVGRGRDRTCYLSTADLCLPIYELAEILLKGWEETKDSAAPPRPPTQDSCGTVQ